jgi:hypothetical protein
MKPVEEGSPVIGSIDMLRPVNGNRFLVSFSQLCRGLGRHVECLLWDPVAVSFSRWRAAGQRKCRPGLIGGVLAIGAGLRVGVGGYARSSV